MSQFKVGDTVRLKSGGPVMTVYTASGESDTHGEGVDCCWFNVKNNFKCDGFDPDILVLAEPFDQEKVAKAIVKDFVESITASLPFPLPGLDPKEQS